jgi:uncharacterized protein (DUF433 family)
MNATEVKFDHPYVEYHHGGYWIAGTRVALDSIVYRWREGLSAETIQNDCFPVLTLSHVFGALAYYLDHQAEIDEYLIKSEEEEEAFVQQLRQQYPETHRKLDALLQEALARQR